MGQALGYSEQFIGYTYTINSIAAIVACVLYGLYSKRIPLRILLHGSVASMVLSSLVYIGLGSQLSAVIISLAYGFIYMITTLTQLELAGRYCPPEAAGTVFALLMSIMNLSVGLSSIVGGRFYEAWKISYGVGTAYTLLVIVGAGFTALAWFLVLLFPRESPELATEAVT
jgi:predicted MFS family arabinose efflux permease